MKSYIFKFFIISLYLTYFPALSAGYDAKKLEEEMVDVVVKNCKDDPSSKCAGTVGKEVFKKHCINLSPNGEQQECIEVANFSAKKAIELINEEKKKNNEIQAEQKRAEEQNKQAAARAAAEAKAEQAEAAANARFAQTEAKLRQSGCTVVLAPTASDDPAARERRLKEACQEQVENNAKKKKDQLSNKEKIKDLLK